MPLFWLKQWRSPYALFLESLKKSKKARLAKFVLRNLESLVVVYPVNDVIVVNTIRFAQEIRDISGLNIATDVKLAKKELDMGIALVNSYIAPFDVAQFKKEYPVELMKIIEPRVNGQRSKKSSQGNRVAICTTN